MSWRTGVMVLTALAVLGCEIDAETRAANDKKVGHFAAGAVRVDVDDGLAAIRVADGKIRDLHVAAPTITIRVQGPINELALTNLAPDDAVDRLL